MRNKRLLRAGLASLTIGGLALSAFIVACGDDDTGGAGVTPGVDSGNDTGPKTDSGSSGNIDSGSSGNVDSGSDSGPKDGGGDADASKTPPAKLQLINAATSLGPGDQATALRICYKVGLDTSHLIWASLPPLPNRKSSDAQPFPGLFSGTGGPVDGTGVSLEKLIVRPYVLSAQSLQAHGLGSQISTGQDKFCADIIDADAGGAFVQNTDYWILDDIQPNTFVDGNSYLLALTGCAGGSTSSACGGDAGTGPGNGNLAIHAFQIDNTTAVDATKLGVQFVNVSPNLEGAIQLQSGTLLHTHPAISHDPADAAAGQDIATSGDVTAFATLTPINQLSNVNNASDFVMANPKISSIAYSMPQVAALSFGVPDSGVYANGKAFTIIAIGDITASPDAGGSFNTKFFHFLALPNDPTIKSFDPTK